MAKNQTHKTATGLELPTEPVIGIYIERSDGDYEFAAAVDRNMFPEEDGLETVVIAIKATLEDVEGETVKMFGFGATDQIVDIMSENEGEEE